MENIELLSFLQDMEARILAQLKSSDAPRRIIYDMNEVKKVTGYSTTVINKLISEGRLTPWQEFPNGKLSFYREEVEALVPKSLLDPIGVK